MKTRFIKGITAVCFAATLLFSSCLKDDNHYFNPSDSGNIFAEFPLGGIQNFASDAITKTGLDTVQFAINIATANSISTPVTVTLGIDNSLITAYNAANPAITYTAPAAAAVKLTTNYTVPVGISHQVIATLIIDRTQLDPAGSYMIPVKIVSSSASISSNFNVHYFHIIGNDFAGSYTYDYRRFQNGTGPGAGNIPSLGQGPAADISNTQTVQLSPVSPTEFVMTTNYNGQGVQYDVTFTRTVSGSVVNYTNWKVKFVDVTPWTNAGITNFVPPAFTIPPPANNSSPKTFEINYASGGSAPGRYIDDTYHK